MPAFLPSELPVRGRVRHHWIVLFHRPHKFLGVALVVMLVLAIIGPQRLAWLLMVLAVVGWILVIRVRKWRAEQIILTQTRIVRIRGLPETTEVEASLRLDRISGAVVQQSPLGKLLGYATIELEAPGNHREFRDLIDIEKPKQFYLQLRYIIFGDGTPPIPMPGEDGRQAAELETAPLPFFDDRPYRYEL